MSCEAIVDYAQDTKHDGHLTITIKAHFFQKHSFRNTIRVSNSLDPDQDRHSVGPNLGPNCFQSL